MPLIGHHVISRLDTLHEYEIVINVTAEHEHNILTTEWFYVKTTRPRYDFEIDHVMTLVDYNIVSTQWFYIAKRSTTT